MTEEFRAILVTEGRKRTRDIGIVKATESNPYSHGSDESEAYLTGCDIERREQEQWFANLVEPFVCFMVVAISLGILMGGCAS